jgi:hypothetical protein
MKTIPLADEVDLEVDETPDDTGAVEVGVDGIWFVDQDKVKAFSDRLAELIAEYMV